MIEPEDLPPKIELIPTGGSLDGAEASEEIELDRRSRLADIMIVALVMIAGAALLSDRSSSPGDPGNPTTPVPTTAADRSSPTTAVDGSSQLAALGDRSVLVVVSDRAGNESQLVSVSASETTISELPSLRNFVFDASGRWLAGTSISRLSEVQEILWVAPVGGVFEPVAIDVRGFAWHDEDPGRIAWTTEERLAVHSLDLEDLTAIGGEAVVDLPVRGAVRGWGDWGYAIQTSYRVPASSVVDHDGRLLAEDLDGVYAGRWHDGRLLFSGGASRSTFVDRSSWRRSPVPFLDDDDYVWTLASSEEESVVLVGERGVRSAPFDGAVVRSTDGRRAESAAPASAYTRLAWLGDAVVFADQAVLSGDTSSAANGLTVLTVRDERIQLALPPLFDQRAWIASIVVPTE